MAGTFPISSTGISTLRFVERDPTVTSEAANGKTHVRKLGGGFFRYEMTIGLPRGTTRAQMDAVLAFLSQQRGAYSAFEIVLPVYSTPRGVATGTPRVNNAAGYPAGTTSIAVDGFTASITGIMRANDKLRFAGHNKVYPVLIDANTDGTGNTVLTIPPLMQAVTDNELITVTSVPFTVRRDGEVQEFGISATDGADRHRLEIDLVESW